jgi:drug/metabolite transporter (DMT)-like permease
VYVYPLIVPRGAAVGLVIVAVGLLGRAVNPRADLGSLFVTTVSMGIGAILFLVSGVVTQGMPPLSAKSWGIILWLAVVNTAFAFTLWNRTLRTLSAMESSLMNTTMLIQIPILVVLSLGEQVTVQEVVGMVLTGAGIALVQLRRAHRV